MKTTTRQTNLIQFGEENLDLSGLEQLVEMSQTRAIAEALCLLRSWIGQSQASGASLAELLQRMDADFDSKVCSLALVEPSKCFQVCDLHTDRSTYQRIVVPGIWCSSVCNEWL